ncbi:hypothetical protein AJ80_02521 [Polytolypa hystricis UAMH7299]|uniref:Aminoglycoside phosphotransferase domain-containing protein n=1 Tax=Polytolypa hystricis (strain UAMH7299) TaxID=1447883 RepID=A0A2B7YQT1_POLH7|nr:hypothetical protein AJ80_02521 [Polytolypa hystricis UAMH7299]
MLMLNYAHSDSAVDNPLFSYTSGRFLYNEKLRLHERYIKFNVTALKDAIERHVQHRQVRDLTRFSEGGFNRIFLAIMEDGFKATVKIPYWISVPKTYATASEVATLTFLRPKGIPVPEVYGWSSTTRNAVGAEYIIMDSQYFEKDVPPQLQSRLYTPGVPDKEGDSETYCIGPIADYMFWPHEILMGMNLFCQYLAGSDSKSYLAAIANKELKWVEKFGKPLECDFPHNTVFPGANSDKHYLRLLQKYLAISPYLFPKHPQDSLKLAIQSLAKRMMAFPAQLSSQRKIRQQTENDTMWCNLNALVSHWRDELDGLTEEGWVRTEAYAHAVKRNKELIAEFSKDGSPDELENTRRGWPFQDREEFF